MSAEMPQPIRLLDQNVANQIAAGEVVERPSSVIKELVENALDAGASVIQVEADQGGRFLRVVDNGHGISADSVALAFQRFATSKLRNYEDVWQLATMGFRGEALPSIASVSRLEVLSRTADAELGHRLVMHGGDVLESGPGGGPVGTSLTIQELFYNTPARLKFMGSENTELGYRQQLMQAFAMSHPHIGFRLLKKGKVSLNTTGRSDLMGVVRQIFGKDMAGSLFAIDHSYRDAKVEGVLSYPDYVRKDRNYQYFFVNQRWVKVPALTKILDDLYADLVPKRNYPVAILRLQLPPETVDVNVHPTKREVRFKNFSLIYQLLKEALEQALNRYHVDRLHLVEAPKPAPEFSSEQQTFASPLNNLSSGLSSEERPPFAPQADEDSAPWQSNSSQASAYSSTDMVAYPKSTPQPYSAPFTTPSSLYAAQAHPAKPDFVAQPATVFQAPPPPEVLTLPGISPLERLQHRGTAEEAKAAEAALLEAIIPVGQVCENTYIIGSFGRDLVLIDQHVAEERHLYEVLIEKGELARQPLLVSVIVDTDSIERELLDQHRELFESAGFEYEPYGPDTIAIRTVPHCLKLSEAEATFKHLLNDLRETGVADARLESYKLLCKTIACHSAIRAGDALTIEQMREIVKNWAKTKNPYTCPHGRPILLKLSKDEINRRFLRTWS